MENLRRVLRPYKGGKPHHKWIRLEGTKPPSQANSHRRQYVKALRVKCIKLLGGKCVSCGYKKDIRALQIDHVYGDAALMRKKYPTRTGGTYYHHIMKELFSGKYQVLCANCNTIKRDENNECNRGD